MLAPRGVQGAFRVRPHSGSADVLLGTTRWFAQLQPDTKGRFSPPPTSGPVVELAIRDVEPLGGELSARVAQIASRDAADPLRRADLFVARSDFPPLPDGQYYWIDLIGLRVANRQSEALGVVRDLMETGPHQVLVVGTDEAPDAQPRLIPFVPAWVDDVDLQARQITVDWQLDY